MSYLPVLSAKGVTITFFKNLDMYQIDTGAKTYMAGLDLTIKRAIRLGINPEDLSHAFEQFIREGHNEAQFGMFGSFLYSLNIDN